MSTAPEPDLVPLIEVGALAELSLDSMTNRGELPSCGICHEAQVYGNVAIVRLGFDAKALCADCWRRFLDAVGIAATAILLPPVPLEEPGAPYSP